jgi:hypothetical protein
MKIRRTFLIVFVFGALLLQACGADAGDAIATGIAQTQQISQLQTEAAGGSQPEQQAQDSATVAPVVASVEVTTSRDVNMRSGDSTAYDVMTVIPGGETVTVTGVSADGSWYQVEYHGAVGWISAAFTNGDVPADMPVVTPSAVASSGGNTGGGNDNGGNNNGGGNNSGKDSFSFSADITDANFSNTVDGELEPGDSDSVTVHLEGYSGSNDTGHLRVTLTCSSPGADSVEVSESISRSNGKDACNRNWEYQTEMSDGDLVITLSLPADFSGSVTWSMTVENK